MLTSLYEILVPSVAVNTPGVAIVMPMDLVFVSVPMILIVLPFSMYRLPSELLEMSTFPIRLNVLLAPPPTLTPLLVLPVMRPPCMLKLPPSTYTPPPSPMLLPVMVPPYILNVPPLTITPLPVFSSAWRTAPVLPSLSYRFRVPLPETWNTAPLSVEVTLYPLRQRFSVSVTCSVEDSTTSSVRKKSPENGRLSVFVHAIKVMLSWVCAS